MCPAGEARGGQDLRRLAELGEVPELHRFFGQAGSAVHDNSLDCPSGPVGSEAPGPPATGTGPGGCTLSVDPSSKSIKKNGGTTATITVSTNIATTITVSAPINLQVSPTTRGMSAGGSGTFSISSLNSTRGTFAVNFTSTCTTDTVLIKVTN